MLKTISDLYKFYLYHPVNGLIEVFPHNHTLEWSWEKNKEESQAFKRKKLNTELVFKKDDFFLLYDLERSNYRCEKILIEIHRECSGGFSLFYTGYLALIDGEYDRDKCIVRIKVRQDDEYTCLLNNWNKEKDFIGGVGAPQSVGEIYFIFGTIEEDSCVKTIYTPELIEEGYFPIYDLCLDDTNLWAFYNMVVENTYFNTITNNYELLVRYIFRREKVILNISNTPNGTGWTIISTDGITNTWVRPYSGIYDVATTTPIKNGRGLIQVIQYLIQECGLNFVSDFFNFNPDYTHPVNFVYDYANQFYKDIIIWQKSDVKRQPRVITDSNGNTHTLAYVSATKAKIKLKDILKWLNEMYNVQWAIIGNTFRIEHYTYWNSSRQNMIDLTQNDRTKGNYNYKYISEELPATETWSWMETTDNSDFDGLPIIYSETCSYDDDDAKDEEYNISKITTNIEYIALNPSEISDDGFVIASTENGVLQSEICRISNKIKVNGANSFANLHYYLHRHGRPQRQGNMNGTDEVFYFPKPTRQGPDVVVPMCCNEVETFDTNFRVKTQMGWGNMVSAKLKDPNGIMTISLLHE